MTDVPLRDLEPYLSKLRALPFVREVVFRETKREGDDGELALRTAKGEWRLFVELKTNPPTQDVVSQLSLRKERAGGEWMLLAPYVGRSLGERLRESGILYLDQPGNCSIQLGEGYLVHIEGRPRPKRLPKDKGVRAPGFRVLFALLADPEAAGRSIREVASLAGVSRQPVSDMLHRLASEGLLVRAQRGYRWTPHRKRQALERWLVGYRDVVRPSLLVGYFRGPTRDVEELEEHIEPNLDVVGEWRWGGGSAGFRLAPHYREPRATLHLADPPPDLAKKLRVIPSEQREGDGDHAPLIVLRFPGPVALGTGEGQSAHPLLVWSELMVSDDERSQEVALEIERRYLRSDP